ncbi:hypothetical protein K440DRAFT_643314 [Wilcoxina mikolae CBS 423.85]|nr:hypothetical protein K440DRAFT_643314 [Wilcoxina mikolae CBS 423.85]
MLVELRTSHPDKIECVVVNQPHYPAPPPPSPPSPNPQNPPPMPRAPHPRKLHDIWRPNHYQPTPVEHSSSSTIPTSALFQTLPPRHSRIPNTLPHCAFLPPRKHTHRKAPKPLFELTPAELVPILAGEFYREGGFDSVGREVLDVLGTMSVEEMKEKGEEMEKVVAELLERRRAEIEAVVGELMRKRGFGIGEVAGARRESVHFCS